MSAIPQQHRLGELDRRWKDKKRYLWLIGLVVPSLAFIGYGLWALTGWGFWFWIGPIVILVVVPAIDLVAGLDRSNPPDDVIEALEQDRYYRWITYLFLPIQYVGFVGAMYLIARAVGGGPRACSTRSASRSRSAASAASASTPPTSSATSARRTSAGSPRSRWRRASTATSTSSTTAATTCGSRRPRTRRSSRVGENFYQFWPRTVLGSLRSAWRIEKRRYARKEDTLRFGLEQNIYRSEDGWPQERLRRIEL